MTRLRLFDPALLDLVEEQRAHNEKLMEVTAAMAAIDNRTPEGIRWIRDAMEPGGAFGFQALDFPEVREIPGPAGPLPIRVLTPETVQGVYLHFHGGAMTVGSARSMDLRNWDFAQALGCVVVSVDYRLAPEDPYPAGPDNCEAAARWLLEHGAAEFGTDRFVMGGESAGAYFTMTTALRLRDGGGADGFRAMDLCYGAYDMSGTPSTVLLRGKVPYATGDGGQRGMYLPGRDLDALRDPDVSPMWAELHDLPPAILTVGTADWLLDESLLMANRLAAAGNDVELAVYPEGPHGVESMPTELGRVAKARIFEFLRARLED